MRYAFVSDIHSNRQAWQAVLTDMSCIGVDAVVCLGDVVGYGPAPAEVLESVYVHSDYCVLGNHDAVVAGKLDSGCFNDIARSVIEWTCNNLGNQARRFFSDLPMILAGEGFACTHAGFSEPGCYNYILEPEDAQPSFNATKEPLLFVGHTHLPCVMQLDPEGFLHYRKHEQFSVQPGWRYLVNVGSVGDPRDGDLRASYGLLDLERQEVTIRKVVFDIDGYREDIVRAGIATQPYLFRIRAQQPPRQVNELLSFRPPKFATVRTQTSAPAKSTLIDPEKIREIRSVKSKEAVHLNGRRNHLSSLFWAGIVMILIACLVTAVFIWKGRQARPEFADTLESPVWVSTPAPDEPADRLPKAAEPKPMVDRDVPETERSPVVDLAVPAPQSVGHLMDDSGDKDEQTDLSEDATVTVPVTPPPVETLLEEAATALIDNRYRDALALLDASDERDAVRSARLTLVQIGNIDELIKETFKNDIGKTIEVELRTGKKSLLISAVTPQGIEAQEEFTDNGKAIGWARIRLSTSQLDSQERMRRIDSIGGPTASMYRGMLALRENHLQEAKQHFVQSRTAFGRILGAMLGDFRKQRKEDAAKASWGNLRKWRERPIDRAKAMQLLDQLATFESLYGDTQIAQEVKRDIFHFKNRLSRMAVDNFVVNGDFESGEVNPWRATSENNTCSATVINEDVHGGHRAMRVHYSGTEEGRTRAGNPNSIELNINLPGGTWYIAETWMRFEEGDPCFFNMWVPGTALRRVFETERAAKVWRRYRLLFRCESNRVSLFMSAGDLRHAYPRNFVIDDVKVIRAEPVEGIPSNAMRFRGNAYRLFRAYTSWETARRYCEAMGGHLWTVGSSGEVLAVAELFENDDQPVFLGLKHVGQNRYEWVTGEPLTFTRWHDRFFSDANQKGQPVFTFPGKNNNWMHTGKIQSRWFVCEWEGESANSREMDRKPRIPAIPRVRSVDEKLF